MNRPIFATLALTSLSFASCDRQTAAEFVLSVGLNAASYQELLATLDTENVAEPKGELFDAIFALREFDVEAADSELRLRMLLRDIDRAADNADTIAETELERSIVQEARLAALRVAAQIDPEVFLNEYSDMQKTLGVAPHEIESLSRKSVQRLVTQFLGGSQMDSAALRALSMHAASYPDLPMNVQLYMTAIERLGNEQRLPESIFTARQGIAACSQLAGAGQLENVLAQLYAQNPGEVGVPMQFAGPELNGGRFSLESTRGQPTLVVFWATWCPACQERVPALKQLSERYRHFDLQIACVSLDERLASVSQFVAEHELDWPQIVIEDPNRTGWRNPIAKYYGVESIPCSFLLNEQGEVVATRLNSAEAVESALQQYLADRLRS